MKVLVLGGSGMLGHRLVQVLNDKFETYATLRLPRKLSEHDFFRQVRTLDNVSVQDHDGIVRAIATVRPDVIVNCIGIVKQSAVAKDPLTSILVNSLFPHRLAQLCLAARIRLIHISTDCVFSGRKGNYVETDLPDAEDIYGRTKLLGEVSYEGCLTIRTSMIGREIETTQGLVEWFLAQQGKTIQGYKRAVFSGFTTHALAEIVAWIIAEHRTIDGVWHVASEPINKFELLSLIQQIGGLNISIEPDETFVCDRSLNADRFRLATGFAPPPWRDMVEQMCQSFGEYSLLRRQHAYR